jgi:hypothetical protein
MAVMEPWAVAYPAALAELRRELESVEEDIRGEAVTRNVLISRFMQRGIGNQARVAWDVDVGLSPLSLEVDVVSVMTNHTPAYEWGTRLCALVIEEACRQAKK